jgi:hypothetical protein
MAVQLFLLLLALSTASPTPSGESLSGVGASIEGHTRQAEAKVTKILVVAQGYFDKEQLDVGALAVVVGQCSAALGKHSATLAEELEAVKKNEKVQHFFSKALTAAARELIKKLEALSDQIRKQLEKFNVESASRQGIITAQLVAELEVYVTSQELRHPSSTQPWMVQTCAERDLTAARLSRTSRDERDVEILLQNFKGRVDGLRKLRLSPKQLGEAKKLSTQVQSAASWAGPTAASAGDGGNFQEWQMKMLEVLHSADRLVVRSEQHDVMRLFLQVSASRYHCDCSALMCESS